MFNEGSSPSPIISILPPNNLKKLGVHMDLCPPLSPISAYLAFSTKAKSKGHPLLRLHPYFICKRLKRLAKSHSSILSLGCLAISLVHWLSDFAVHNLSQNKPFVSQLRVYALYTYIFKIFSSFPYPVHWMVVSSFPPACFPLSLPPSFLFFFFPFLDTGYSPLNWFYDAQMGHSLQFWKTQV